MLHQEADGIAALAATKTLVNLLGRRHREGGGLLVVKRAQTQVAGTPFFQFYKLADNINNIDATEYLLYGILTYQCFIDINVVVNGEDNKTGIVVTLLCSIVSFIWYLIYNLLAFPGTQ